MDEDFISPHTCGLLEMVPHLMHQRWPWGVQQGWQQGGGAAETAMKKERQRVTQGQPAAAAALALLASAPAAAELWGHAVVQWPVLLEAELLHSMYQSPSALASQIRSSDYRFGTLQLIVRLPNQS